MPAEATGSELSLNGVLMLVRQRLSWQPPSAPVSILCWLGATKGAKHTKRAVAGIALCSPSTGSCKFRP